MPAVRSRRPATAAPPPPKPQPKPAAKLAAIQAERAKRAAKAKPRSIGQVAFGGGFLFAGLGVAGAALLGSSLFDLGETVAIAADRTATAAGFAVRDIAVTGVDVGSADELRALALPEDRASMLAADPRAVKARAESLDWVANVEVRRLWPSRLEIRVERRDAIARWQEDGDVSLIDVNGERVLTRRAAARDDLPLVVGENAGPAARDMLAALDAAPAVRERTTALVRVGGRRWDLRLRSGADVSLPESGVGDALETLEVLQADHRLLDRPVARIDLRDPARLVVTPRAPATAAAETARQGA